MAAYSREILMATGLLCSRGGSMPLLQLHQELLQRCSISEEDLCFMVVRCPRFLLLRGEERLHDCTVIARTSLRLCSRYRSEEGCGRGSEEGGGCQELHLCKFFVYGNCRFGKGRKLCKYSHDIRSDHNYGLLRELTLHELSEDDLFTLLLQNDPTLLPEVCLHYNKGLGPRGSCSFQQDCTKVHLCQHFVKGDCAFGLQCKRQHAIDQQDRRMLEQKGLSGGVIQELPFIYRNIHHLRAVAAASPENPPDSSRDTGTNDRNIICLHFLRHTCRFQYECRHVHFHLPYKWEVLDGDTWTDLPHMEDIERDYCDPSKTQSDGARPVDFLAMCQELRPVRRLSTVSSVMKPPHYTLTTDWLWYYKGDRGNWVEYGQLDEKQRSTSVTSQTLEQDFLSERHEVELVKGQRRYVIRFTDMYQRNPKHKTRRRVRRRPRFVSVAEVEKQAAQ